MRESEYTANLHMGAAAMSDKREQRTRGRKPNDVPSYDFTELFPNDPDYSVVRDMIKKSMERRDDDDLRGWDWQ